MRPELRRSLLAAAVFAPCLTASAGPFQFELIADQTTSSIGVGNVLLYVGTPSVRGGRVVFAAQENYRNAVMCHENGSLSALLYYDAPITGTTTPAQLQLHNMGMDLWWPSVSPAGVAFSSRDLWGTGLYSIPSVGGPACLMHNSQQVPIPGGTGTFQSMGIVSLDGGDLVFRSLQSGAPGGFYRYSGSQVTRIADGATVIPETTYTAVSFGSYPAVHAGTVVFSAANASAGVRAIVATAERG
jgi:hypothetical protein